MRNVLKNIGAWLQDILNAIKDHLMSIIFVLLVYIMLWFVPQINDLIIVVNQSSNHWIAVPLFFAALLVFAFFISVVGDYFDPPELEQSAGVMSAKKTMAKKEMSFFKMPRDAKELYIKQKDQFGLSSTGTFSESAEDYVKRVFPKVLGAILILAAAFAVNHTFSEVFGKNISFLGSWGFLAAIIIMLLGLNQALVQTILSFWRKAGWFYRNGPVVLVLSCLLAIVTLGFYNQGGTEGDAERLFYALILLAVVFLVSTLSYNKKVIWFKDKIGAYLTIIAIVVILVSYIVLFFAPRSLEVYTPLTIILVCIIGMFTIFNLIKICGRRIDIPLLGIVLILGVIAAIYNANKNDFDHYDASYSTELKHTPDQRLTLDQYVDQWIEDRRALIQNQAPGEQFPIIFVSAEGGGSRAGLWSFLVQSHLFDSNPDYFRKYLFAMTGASGGGGGNNMFYAQAYELLDNPNAKPLKYKDTSGIFKYCAGTIYNKDYLSASVASLLGRDLFKNITNIGDFCDRGALLEDQWEKQYAEVFERSDNPLGQAYLNLMPQKGAHQYIRPIIITNTTELQSGERAIISPVKTNGDTHGLGVFRDLLKAYPKKDTMIKRSTAMSMNARFPYISPAARIDSVGQYGDAGYYNNIGGNVTIRLQEVLRRALESDTTLTGKYQIKNLLITNYVEPPKKVTYSSQLLAPLVMIANATFAHPKESEGTLTNVVNVQSKRTKITQNIDEDGFMSRMRLSESGTIEPIIPLGRFLSQSAVRSLEKRLENDTIQAQLKWVMSKGL